MRPFPTSAQVRAKLAELVEADSVTLRGLSIRMGRGPDYLRRFVKLGRPEWLEPADRDYLARWFNVDTFELGDRDKVRPD
jgi:hypothetical protein